MASTYTIDRVIRYVRRYINRAPLTFSDTNDPALMIGDWVRNLILAPPFAWRWNRGTTTAACVVGQNDYVINLPKFGWIEQASITDNSVSPASANELEIGLTFTKEIVNNQPTHIAAWLDDNNGNITFRLQPPPDKTYTLNITYQNASPKFGSTTDTWAPIPDYFEHIYQQGFLAKAYEYLDDQRFPATIQMFVRTLLAASEGLDQSQKNIFLTDMLNTQVNQQNTIQSSQAGTSSRSLS